MNESITQPYDATKIEEANKKSAQLAGLFFIIALLIGGLIGAAGSNIYWEQRMKNAMGGLETIEEIINCPVEFATDRKTGENYVIYRFKKSTEIVPLDKPLK